MKRRTLAISLLLLIGGSVILGSCKKLEELVKINVGVNSEVAFEIPIIPVTGTTPLAQSSFNVNLDSIIKNQNSSLGVQNIKEVNITSCELTMSNGDADNNFSFIESCTLSMSSNVKTNLEPIGTITNNPNVAAYVLSMTMDKEKDLKEYFVNATSINYALTATVRKTTSKPLQCKAVVRYNMVVALK